MEHYNDIDYIYHYGVLGMKWGQRRARINTSKATSARKKGDIVKAKKYSQKAKKIEAKHRSRAGDKAYNRVKATSTGKLILQTTVMGTYGTLKYHQAKSKNNSTGKAAVKGILAGTINRASYGVLGVVEPRVTASRKK